MYINVSQNVTSFVSFVPVMTRVPPIKDARSKAMVSSQCHGHPCRHHRSGGGVLPSATWPFSSYLAWQKVMGSCYSDDDDDDDDDDGIV